MYYFYLYNKEGEKYNIPFETLNIADELNKGVYGSLQINYFALKRYSELFGLYPDDIVASSYRTFEIYREQNRLYGGVLVSREISGSGASATNYVLNFCDWFNALERKITGNDSNWWFTNTDSGDIAWEIIDKMQAIDDLGITRGTHPSTVNRDRTFRYSNLRDEIYKMSGSNLDNGFDFEITPEKVFNIFYPKKGELRENIRLDDSNIISWGNIRNLSNNLANEITVIGEGEGDDMLVSVREELSSQTTWGIQQQVLSAKDITTQSTLDSKGDRLLAEKGSPRDNISIRVNDRNPDIESYSVGDSLPVEIKIINFNEDLRVRKKAIQVRENGEAQIDLSLDYE